MAIAQRKIDVELVGRFMVALMVVVVVFVECVVCTDSCGCVCGVTWRKKKERGEKGCLYLYLIVCGLVCLWGYALSA